MTAIFKNKKQISCWPRQRLFFKWAEKLDRRCLLWQQQWYSSVCLHTRSSRAKLPSFQPTGTEICLRLLRPPPACNSIALPGRSQLFLSPWHFHPHQYNNFQFEQSTRLQNAADLIGTTERWIDRENMCMRVWGRASLVKLHHIVENTA